MKRTAYIVIVILAVFILLGISAYADGDDKYETGITYEQLITEPNTFKGSYMNFTGTVYQVIEDTEEGIAGIFLVDGMEQKPIFFGYERENPNFYLLEGDKIKVYGGSLGMWTYENIYNEDVTIPGMYVEKIDVLAQKNGLFDEEKVISQLDVTELHYSDIWDYDFLIVRNNSEYDLDLRVDVLYYDEYDKIIGVTSREEEVVESGYPVLFWFMPDDKYSRVEYTFGVEQEDLYEPVTSDLSYEESVTDSKVILSVTNNGKEPADFVEGTVIFFNNGNPVGFDWTYFTDDDSELKPGKTIIKEFSCYDSFDSYDVYFSGRRGGFF